MAYYRPPEGGIDYAPCRYGASKLLFRGPRRDTSGDFVAYLGSTETYGKFIETPYPERVAERTGLPSVNFGCVNAGVDTFHEDHTVIGLCQQARACVVQVMGADRLSNRLYSVHGRRNDRFISATETLRRLYPSVDFAEIHFTRHLLGTLRAADPQAFAEVTEALARDWCERMASLVSRIRVPVILLWLTDQRPGAPRDGGLGPEPLFVTGQMIETLEPCLAHIIQVPAPAFSGEAAGPGMAFSELDLPAARGLPGPEVHEAVADALKAPLKELWRRGGRKDPAAGTVRGLMSG